MAGFSARKKSIITCKRCLKEDGHCPLYPGRWDEREYFSIIKKSIIICERCLNKDFQVCGITGHIFSLEKAA
jgi:hypothetical protein